MVNITVDDQTRSYSEAKGLFVKEVAKGNATASKALPAVSTNLPEPIISDLIQKTKGGSGTKSCEIRMQDHVAATESAPTRDAGIAIHVTGRPTVDLSHLCAMLSGLVSALIASDGAWLNEILEGMHRE